MARGARSARGEIVDFDLLRIKENLGAAPKASTVKAREDFIDQKFKRRLRRMTETAVTAPVAPRAPVPETTEVAIDATAVQADVVEVVAPAKKKIVSASE